MRSIGRGATRYQGTYIHGERGAGITRRRLDVDNPESCGPGVAIVLPPCRLMSTGVDLRRGRRARQPALYRADRLLEALLAHQHATELVPHQRHEAGPFGIDVDDPPRDLRQ